MSSMQPVAEKEFARDIASAVNDFSITVCTVNGSGSQTSNLTLLRALFKMGIPVSGKNLFPSNIQGLPTYYTIRVSKDGFLARQDDSEIVIAMNPATFQHDLELLCPGGVFIYPDDARFNVTREDVYYIHHAGKTAYPGIRRSFQLAGLCGEYGLCRRPVVFD